MWTVYIMWFYKALKNRNSMPYSFVKTVHSKWVCLLLRALSWTPTEILIFFELQFYMKYITLNHIHILHYAYAIVCFQNKKYTNNIFSKTIQTLNFRCDCSQRNWYYRMRKTFTKQQFWTNYIMFFFAIFIKHLRENFGNELHQYQRTLQVLMFKVGWRSNSV